MLLHIFEEVNEASVSTHIFLATCWLRSVSIQIKNETIEFNAACSELLTYVFIEAVQKYNLFWLFINYCVRRLIIILLEVDFCLIHFSFYLG